MTSMTGFGFGDGSHDSLRFAIELKSYNNRYLELILNIPPALASWEPELRQRLAKGISRGRVELTIRLKDNLEELQIVPHLAAVEQYKQALLAVKKASKVRGCLRLEHFLRYPELFSVLKDRNLKELWEALEPVFQKVMDDFLMTRRLEGEYLKSNILDHLKILQSGCAEIMAQESQMEQVFRQTLQRRWEELKIEKDENRIFSEIALLLMRYGMNEELVRLSSHIEAFQNIAQNHLVGKKLDFLCQEIGREINTIGSKAPFAEIQQKVVNMKEALENIREQLRNVE